VLLQERVAGEVCSVTSGGEDDGAMLSILSYRQHLSTAKNPLIDWQTGAVPTYMLSILLVLNAHDLLTLLNTLCDLGLLHDLHSVRLVLSQVLKLHTSTWIEQSGNRLTFSIKA